AVFVRLADRFGLDAGREVLRFMSPEARLADAAEQVLESAVAEEVDALFGEVELHLLGGFFRHSPRAEQRLLPRGHLGRLADVQVPLVDQLLDDFVEQLGELALEIGVAGRVARGLAAQQLEHLGRELPRVHEGLKDRLPQRIERAVGLVLAELAPEGMRVRASGEPRLQEKIGELIEQGLEIERVGQLGEVARIRRVFHRLPTPNIGRRRAFPQWTELRARSGSGRWPTATSVSSSTGRASPSSAPGCSRWRSAGSSWTSPTPRSPSA